MGMKTHYQKVFETVLSYENQAVHDGSLAAELHAYYNEIGLKEGWLKPEYATPLSQQDKINQIKNIEASLDVVKFWEKLFKSQRGTFHKDNHLDIIRIMQESIISFLTHRKFKWLDQAGNAQHQQWQRFVTKHQKERITPGHAKFREDNYKQFKKSYSQLSVKEKDQDRLIIAVITDRILELADIGHKRWINI